MLSFLGTLGIGAFALVVYWGLQYTTATNNLMMQGAMPSMILLLSTVIFRDRITIGQLAGTLVRSEEHTSELQSLMRISYAVFCLKKKKTHKTPHIHATVNSKDQHQHTQIYNTR